MLSNRLQHGFSKSLLMGAILLLCLALFAAPTTYAKAKASSNKGKESKDENTVAIAVAGESTSTDSTPASVSVSSTSTNTHVNISNPVVNNSATTTETAGSTTTNVSSSAATSSSNTVIASPVTLDLTIVASSSTSTKQTNTSQAATSAPASQPTSNQTSSNTSPFYSGYSGGGIYVPPSIQGTTSNSSTTRSSYSVLMATTSTASTGFIPSIISSIGSVFSNPSNYTSSKPTPTPTIRNTAMPDALSLTSNLSDATNHSYYTNGPLDGSATRVLLAYAVVAALAGLFLATHRHGSSSSGPYITRKV